MSVSGLLIYESSEIHWQRFGNGPALVVCFHGYGESSEVFSFLESSAQAFSFYALDLPFHGNTKWEGPAIYTSTDAVNIIELLLETEQHDTQAPLTLMGFSLGARIALSVYEKMGDRINRLVLLAPDGIRISSWYRFSTGTMVGRTIFSFTMKYPGWFFGLVSVLRRVGLVSESVMRFVRNAMDTDTKRKSLYSRWVGLRKMRPEKSKLRTLIKKHKTQVKLLYGKHDQIISLSDGMKFCKGLEPNCDLIQIDAGHQLLQKKYTKEIMAALDGASLS